MDELDIFVRIAFFGLGLILLALTVISFLKVREMKILLAAVGFAIFVIEGTVLVGGIFSNDIEELATLSYLVAANFIALVFLYLSIIKR